MNICSSVANIYSPSNPDTNGTEKIVHISEMSLFRGLNCMQELFLGEGKDDFIREVSSFHGCDRALREGSNSVAFFQVILLYHKSLSLSWDVCVCVCVCVQNASSDVDKMILGNKCDLSESRVISTERGKLVWEWGNGRTENDVSFLLLFVSSLSLLFLSPLFSSYPFLPPSPFL